MVDKERIEAMIREKNSDVEKRREIAVRKMIENEKFRDKLSTIKRAPEAEMAKKFLVDFGIFDVLCSK